jgi:hypothetical protein
LREKYGGITEVVPAAEAKKLGLIKTTKVETTGSGGKDANIKKVDASKDKK